MKARTREHNLAVLVISLAMALVAAACSGAGAQRRDARVVELQAIEMKVDRSGDGKAKVYVKDQSALDDEAMAAFRAKNWSEALRLFDLLIKEFPDQVGRYAVEFNAGLCLTRLGRHPEAAQRFALARQHSLGSRNARDAIFLEGEALEAHQQWAEAAALYRSMLEDPQIQKDIGGKLGLLDELEAWARLGIALRKAGDPTRADKAFKSAERLYEDHREAPLVADSEWVARALFERAEIFYELFASIRFRLPVERMKRELEDKSNLFLKAEGIYYRCVRLQNKPWSLAAGLAIGNLYSRLITDIEGAEVPADLDEYTMEVYRDELWNHNEKLAKRALVIFQKNMELAERLGDKGDWVEKSYQGLKRMEGLIEVNTARRVKLLKTPPPALPLPTPATPSGDPPPKP